MDTSSRQKNNKEMSALIDTLNQMYLFNIFRAFHPKAAEYMFFSSAHETFSWIDHMLGHKKVAINLRRWKSYQASYLAIMV